MRRWVVASEGPADLSRVGPRATRLNPRSQPPLPGSADYDPPAVPLATLPVPIVVSRVAKSGKPVALPNVRLVSVRYAHLADAGQAQFRYVLDQPGGPFNPDGDFPTRPEQVFGLDSPGGPYVLAPDDRIAAYGITDAGDYRLLFDGFVQLPNARLTGSSQRIGFAALGTPIRCWDKPLWGAYCRSAEKPTDPADDKAVDGVPVRFNPDGAPNATASGADGKTGEFAHPCFLDPDVCEDRKIGRHWTVAMAARYILARGNPDEEFVKNPLLAALDSLLDSRKPKGGFYDPEEPDSFESKPIVLRDLDVTGDTWPVALAKVLAPHGFLFRFARSVDGNLAPVWKLIAYRRAAEPTDDTKSVHLQAYGEPLDPGRTNVESASISRNITDAANSYRVETAPARYEASFVLEKAFVPSTGDCASPAALKNYDSEESPDFPSHSDDYRLYVFDEAGDGHCVDGDLVTGKATSLKDLLGGDKKEEKYYVKRRRKPRRTLFTRDAAEAPDPDVPDDEDEEDEGEVEAGRKGKARKAVLCISTDYKGPTPGVWDGTGTWYKVSNNWDLLDDRIGIRINVKNPEAWAIGNKQVAFGKTVTSSGGTVKGVSAQAKAGETHFKLMLTCVIESDDAADAIAGKRPAAPGRFEVRRYIDARERYKYDVIAPNSWYNKDPGATAVVARDDSRAALDEALARRAAHEMPKIFGSITIPRLSNSYTLGDRISDIEGRRINLRTNLGTNQGEGDQYPLVTAIEFEFDGRQATTLHLEDSRAALDDEYSGDGA